MLLSKIARSGHTSVEVDGRVIVVGGILRDQGPVADILVVDLPNLEVRMYAPDDDVRTYQYNRVQYIGKLSNRL